MSTEDKYKALHRGGKYKVLKRDGSILIKTTGYGSGGGFKTVIKTIKKHVDQNPGTFLLDYGCGSAKIWHDKQMSLGNTTVVEYLGENLSGFYRYDPFHPKYDTRPENKFNLVVVAEVIEHLPLEEIPVLLKDIASLASDKIIFTIPQSPSNAYFMDGENMHCTLMSKDDWIKLIRKYIPKNTITIKYTP
ncbi:MAG: hypothetical protein CMM02_11970 [Rhodopirellula sp.]|jgi:hypothetical protein|nr:hypothetical protein [Rhodopirellula sp.]|tara:strand:- start:62 stop:631 length:570 start_codon:yes stop_codon:yes gene_type:complete